MPRYKDRKTCLMDAVPRFEAEPSSTHVRNAIGAIERLERDGVALWDEGSDQLSRWREGYTEISVFLNRLGERRYAQKQDLATVLREFIQEFEHQTGRLFQMLYSTSEDPDNDPDVERIVLWFNTIYRFSTYALLSFWIDDKTEETNVKIKINLTERRTNVEWNRNQMNVPKDYRKSTKTI